MLDENKGGRTMDFERLIEDDNSENCNKCKNIQNYLVRYLL